MRGLFAILTLALAAGAFASHPNPYHPSRIAEAGWGTTHWNIYHPSNLVERSEEGFTVWEFEASNIQFGGDKDYRGWVNPTHTEAGEGGFTEREFEDSNIQFGGDIDMRVKRPFDALMEFWNRWIRQVVPH